MSCLGESFIPRYVRPSTVTIPDNYYWWEILEFAYTASFTIGMVFIILGMLFLLIQLVTA